MEFNCDYENKYYVVRARIATAGHCISHNIQSWCNGVAFLFDFRMGTNDSMPNTIISKDSLYFCKRFAVIRIITCI
jgi:hypothetical protein